MKKNKLPLLRHLSFMLFLILYTSINAYNIITKPFPFYDWDESIYMQVGREMLQKHSPIPLWQGHPWLEKPPLIPFIFGLTTGFPVQTEIIARLVSLLATAGVLVLIYLWLQKIFKNAWLSTLGVVLTAFNPIFIQRAQVVNGDTFLLAGWLGYLLFASNFWVSFLFLFLGMMSKSLLGFYPAILLIAFHLYRFIFEKKRNELKSVYPALLQIALLSVWYIVMLAMYKGSFLEVHFQDHLLRRVTQSIESHFGQRTFYIDLVIAQYGWLLIAAALSALYIMYRFLKQKISSEMVYCLFFLAPWFVFLNLTKTKITWYLYPAIPLFPMLIIYPFTLLNAHNKLMQGITVICMGYILYAGIVQGNFFNSTYSRFDSYYAIATTARNNCSDLNVLVSPTDRQTHDTLKKLGDLLSTTEWYDGHPAMVYYSHVPTDFIYEKSSLARRVSAMKKGECLALEQEDNDVSIQTGNFTHIKSSAPLVLLQKN